MYIRVISKNFLFFLSVAFFACDYESGTHHMQASSEAVAIPHSPILHDNNSNFFIPDKNYLWKVLLLYGEMDLADIGSYKKKIDELAKFEHVHLFVGLKFDGSRIADSYKMLVSQTFELVEVQNIGTKLFINGLEGFLCPSEREIFYSAKDIRFLIMKNGLMPENIDFITDKSVTLLREDQAIDRHNQHIRKIKESISFYDQSLLFTFACQFLGDFVHIGSEIREVYKHEDDPILTEFFKVNSSQRRSWIHTIVNFDLYLVILNFLNSISPVSNKCSKDTTHQIIALFLSYTHFSKLSYIEYFKTKFEKYLNEVDIDIRGNRDWILETKKPIENLRSEVADWQAVIKYNKRIPKKYNECFKDITLPTMLFSLRRSLGCEYTVREYVNVGERTFPLLPILSVGRMHRKKVKDESLFCNNYSVLFELFEGAEVLGLNSLMHIFHTGDSKGQILELYSTFKIVYDEFLLLSNDYKTDSVLIASYIGLMKSMKELLIPKKSNKKQGKKSKSDKKAKIKMNFGLLSEDIAKHRDVIHDLVPSNENIRLLLGLFPLINFLGELEKDNRLLSSLRLQQLVQYYLNQLDVLNVPTVYAYLCLPHFFEDFSKVDTLPYLREILSIDMYAFKKLKQYYEKEAIPVLIKELVRLKSANLLDYSPESIQKILNNYLPNKVFELEEDDEEDLEVDDWSSGVIAFMQNKSNLKVEEASIIKDDLYKSLRTFLIEPTHKSNKTKFKYLREHSLEEYEILKHKAKYEYEKYKAGGRFFQEFHVLDIQDNEFIEKFALNFSIRTGIFFIKLPKSIAMSDIDFTPTQMLNKQEVEAELCKDIETYARDNKLEVYITSTENGMHAYILDAHKLKFDDLMKHMINLDCDESYLSTFLNINEKEGGSVRISKKIFKKNTWGLGYSSSLESNDILQGMSIEASAEHAVNKVNKKYSKYFETLFAIMKNLDYSFINNVLNDSILQNTLIWFQANCKLFQSEEMLNYYTQPLIEYMRNLIDIDFNNNPAVSQKFSFSFDI
jgi:hypothetical protein